ncbi:hypothetical protein ACFLVN_04925 [Chloroflexota bacterium]
MVKKGYTPEQIIGKLRDAEIILSQGARCQGRTLTQTFTESLDHVKEKMLDEIVVDNATCQLLS